MSITEMTAARVGLTSNPNQHIPQIHTDAVEIAGLAKLKYEVLTDKPVSLGHQKATEYIDLPIFPGEREVSDSHVQTLFDEMRKGTFNEMLVILSTAIFQGVTYKINGQHTAWAVLYMHEVRKGYTLNVREIRYRVSSMDQLKLLYASYDRLKARTDSHVAKVFLVGTDAARDIWSSVISTVSGAYRSWRIESPRERQRVSPEQVAAMIQRDHTALFNMVARYVQDHRDERFAMRAPIISALFATFEKLPTKAGEFWDPVITGVGLPGKTDPRYGLRDTLLNSKTGGSGSDKRLIGNEDLYRISIAAWNKWRRDEKVHAAIRPTNERQKPI